MASLKKKVVGGLASFLMNRVLNSIKNKSALETLHAGEKLGRRFHALLSSRRRVALDNLRMVFPEKRYIELEEITLRVFESFGRSSYDFLRGDFRTQKEFDQTTTVIGADYIKKAVAEGKGVLCVTGHLGNWERVTAWLSQSDYQVSVVLRDADTGGVNSIVNRIRTKLGAGLIPRGKATREILMALKRKEIVGILPDQNSDDVYVPFFGFLAGSAIGPGKIVEKTGAIVIPASCVYAGDGQYEIVFYPRLEPDASYENRAEGMVASINTWLESVIREYPDQYLWFHDRWRNARRKGLL